MRLLEKIQKLNDKDFKQLVGVKRETFLEMVNIVQKASMTKSSKRGRPSKLSIEEQLLMTLKYLRQYVTQKELAFEFEVGEATVCDTIKKIEDILVKSDKFSLPGKKELLEENSIEIILVDVTESMIERPKKSKKSGILGKRSDIQ